MEIWDESAALGGMRLGGESLRGMVGWTGRAGLLRFVGGRACESDSFTNYTTNDILRGGYTGLVIHTERVKRGPG
jgi:hypothetical protein